MSSVEDWLRELEPGSGGRAAGATSDEHTWNILVQVLLPMVFVLTFVIITGIIAYRVAYEGIREIIDKDSDISVIQAQERLVEVQLQKLLRALEEVKAERRAELRIVLFPEAGRIRRRGAEITDDDFRFLCRRTIQILNDGAQAARLAYAEEIYQQVLAKAGVRDPSGQRVRRWGEQAASFEMLDRAETLSAVNEDLVAANRRRIHNAVLDFVDGLEEQTVALQIGVVRGLFEDLLAAGAAEELDVISAQALHTIVDPATSRAERRRAADQLSRGLLRRWRKRLEQKGYPFLDRSWLSVQG